MISHLRIQTKLLLAFTLVGLLSILVGVFVPLRIISLWSPQKSRELLQNTERNIFEFYKTWTEEPKLISDELNQVPEFIQAFESQDRSRVRQLLEERANRLGFTFLPEKTPNQLKYRYIGVLWTSQEYREWQKKLPKESAPTNPSLRLFRVTLGDPSKSLYIAGSVVPIHKETSILGGLLIGQPMIFKDPSQPGFEDSLYDNDRFSEAFEKIHNISVEVIRAESQKFKEFLRNNPQANSTLVDQRQIYRLAEAEIFNVASQIIFIPVEDTDGNSISFIYLHTPVPPETHAWNALTGTFYYGIAFALVLAFLMALFISRTISRPIMQLNEGASALSRGNLDYQVQVRTHDEVGELAKTFLDMRSRLGQTLEELQQRARTIEEKNIALDQSLAEISRMRDFTEDILRSIDGGVITFDLTGRVTKINAAASRILRIPETCPEDEVRPYIPESILEVTEKVLKTGQTVDHLETQAVLSEGTLVPIDLNVSLLISAEHTIGAVTTFYDLTQVRALKEQIRRQEHLAALGTLSAGIAHEIRNPLGIIKGAAEILQKRFGNLKEEEGLSEFILEEVQRLSQVLSEFLDFARPRTPNLIRSNLNTVLSRSLQLANLPETHPAIKIETDLDPKIPLFEMDPDQCQQAFLNLILNAAQAMPEGGKLQIKSAYPQDSNEVIAEIRDSGSGISTENNTEIFNPFFTTKDKGTGLGLSIVHRIVENHHAHINFESTVGQGTIFRICFPVSNSTTG